MGRSGGTGHLRDAHRVPPACANAASYRLTSSSPPRWRYVLSDLVPSRFILSSLGMVQGAMLSSSRCVRLRMDDRSATSSDYTLERGSMLPLTGTYLGSEPEAALHYSECNRGHSVL